MSCVTMLSMLFLQNLTVDYVNIWQIFFKSLIWFENTVTELEPPLLGIRILQHYLNLWRSYVMQDIHHVRWSCRKNPTSDVPEQNITGGKEKSSVFFKSGQRIGSYLIRICAREPEACKTILGSCYALRTVSRTLQTALVNCDHSRRCIKKIKIP